MENIKNFRCTVRIDLSFLDQDIEGKGIIWVLGKGDLTRPVMRGICPADSQKSA